MARHTSRPRYVRVLAALPCRFRGWCRVPNWDSARSRFRELRWGITSVLRPDTGQRDSRPVAHSGLKPRDQPAAALAESTLPKLHKISVVEIWRRPPYAFHLLATRTRTGEVRSRTTNTSFGVQLPPWRSRTAGTTSFQSYRFNRFLSG